LGLKEAIFPDFPQTQGLYTHFSDVARFGSRQPPGSVEPPPYPVDDAALHHVFEGGWIWVLRFNNGLTSAGVAATEAIAERLRLAEGAPAWHRLLDLLPAVREQFADAKEQLPFVHAPKLAFLSDSIAGQRWAMLPSAAGFVDPLLSTGFPLTLLGVARLGEIIARDWGSSRFVPNLETYAAQTRSEVMAAARLIGALYATMNNFPLFCSLSLLYFAAASFAETVRRLDKPQLASSFLLCADPVFGPALARLCDQARRVRTQSDSIELSTAILRAIEPFNVAGLGQANRHNWFPVDANDLLHAAEKLGATEDAIRGLLRRSGFEGI
jgi:FADH2 O2-dependent halogenase